MSPLTCKATYSQFSMTRTWHLWGSIILLIRPIISIMFFFLLLHQPLTYLQYVYHKCCDPFYSKLLAGDSSSSYFGPQWIPKTWNHTQNLVMCIFLCCNALSEIPNLSDLMQQKNISCSCNRSYKCAHAQVNEAPCSAQWLSVVSSEVHSPLHSLIKKKGSCLIVKYIFWSLWIKVAFFTLFYIGLTRISHLALIVFKGTAKHILPLAPKEKNFGYREHYHTL